MAAILPKVMRILLVAPEFPPMIGGMETYAWELGRHLSQSHDVAFLCRKGSAVLPGTRFYADREQITAESILLTAEHFRTDVVHLLNAGLAPAALQLEEKGIPAVVTVHGKDCFQPWLTTSSEDVLAALKVGRGKMIAVSELVRERLVKCHVPSDRIVVVPHGVDTDRFAPRPREGAHGPRILTVARLTPRKNIEAVIAAVEALLAEFPRLEYHVVGPVADAAYASSLAALVKERGLGKVVRFLGPKPHAEIARYYAWADVFALLSSEPTSGDIESFGISCLEAMSCGIPVIISEESGIAPYVRKGGILVPARDQASLQKALRTLLSDRDARERMGREARRIAEKMSWTRCAERTVAVYQEAQKAY